LKKTAAAASALALGALGTAAHADETDGKHDWTGFYVGAGAGFTNLNADWDIDGGEGGLTNPSGSKSSSGDTGAIAAQAGYNYQLGPVVVGGEIDYSLTDFDETARFDGGEGAELRTKIQHFGTVRARVGYAMDKVLVFGTGGLALSDLKSTYDSLAPSLNLSVKHSSPTVGWVAGGGFEFAAAENVTLFLEGMFAAFQGEGTATGPFYNDHFDVDTELALGRFGVNIKF
jgi:outer membrane immunogenic protein